MKDTLKAPTMLPVITTDCAANMKKAAKDLGFYWIRCSLHCIHNSVRAGLTAVEDSTDVFDKVKSFVNLIHKSPKQAELFRECQLDEIREYYGESSNKEAHNVEAGSTPVIDDCIVLWELDPDRDGLEDKPPKRVLSLIN